MFNMFKTVYRFAIIMQYVTDDNVDIFGDCILCLFLEKYIHYHFQHTALL